MVVLAYLALSLWVPVSVVIFSILPPRTAAITCLFVGWLCLPTLVIELPEVPDPDRNMVVGLGILAGSLLFDSRRWLALRPRWFDLPMVVLCLSPFFSSVSNDLGPYDGLSAVFESTVRWLPFYLVGRMYFADAAGLFALARAILIAVAVCLPLLLLEVRLSPKLHWWVYGIANSISGDGFVRGFGIWKPVLMFPHALNTASFVAAGFVCGVWFLWKKNPRTINGIAAGYWTAAAGFGLLITQVLGGWGAAVLGIAALWTLKGLRVRLFMCVLALAPAGWMLGRGTQVVSGDGLINAVQSLAGDRRAESLTTRVDNETTLVAKAMERPLLGWGRWGRNRVYDENGKDLSLTDGLWVIQLGTAGIVGLVALVAIGTLPGLLLIKRFGPAVLNSPEMAGATALSVIVSLSLLNNVFNAFINPLALVAAGGLMAMTKAVARVRAGDSNSAFRSGADARSPVA